MLYKVSLFGLNWLTVNLIDAVRYFFLCQSFLNFHFILVGLKIRKMSNRICALCLLKILIENVLFEKEIVLLLIRAYFNSAFHPSNVVLISILFWFDLCRARPFLSCSAGTRLFHILTFIPFEYPQYLRLRIP